MELLELAETFLTDKNLTHAFKHGYTLFYEGFFRPYRHRAKSVLEVGIFEGQSLRMWASYFEQASIYGADINPELLFQDGRIKCLKTDQTSRKDLTHLAEQTGNLDIIVDDGYHSCKAQQVTLATLFPRLNNGGLFVVEDLYFSYYHGIDGNDSYETSTLNMLKRWQTMGKISAPHMTAEECSYLEKNIESIHIFKKQNNTIKELGPCREPVTLHTDIPKGEEHNAYSSIIAFITKKK